MSHFQKNQKLSIDIVDSSISYFQYPKYCFFFFSIFATLASSNNRIFRRVNTHRYATGEAQRNFRLDLWPCPRTMVRANPRWNPVHSNRRLHSPRHRVYIRGAMLLCRDFFHSTLMRIRMCMSVGFSSTVFFSVTPRSSATSPSRSIRSSEKTLFSLEYVRLSPNEILLHKFWEQSNT